MTARPFHLCRVCNGHERLVYANGSATRRGKPAGWYHVKCLHGDQPVADRTDGSTNHVHRDETAFVTRSSRVVQLAL